MSAWTPAAILPNLRTRTALDGEAIALAPRCDQRVQQFCEAHPKYNDLLSRFSDAFGVPLNPVSIIVRDDVIHRVPTIEPIASFRDLVTASVVPYARALGTVYEQQIPRMYYSNSFWLHPWMLAADYEHLVCSTPAVDAFHGVERFQGQCDPELPVRELKFSEIDRPLFEALESRWRQHYLEQTDSWSRKALFRSLNMADHASQMPAGIGVTLFDIGRIVALWVSALEILAHPGGNARSNRNRVSELLHRAPYNDAAILQPSFDAGKLENPSPLKWHCEQIYRLRNDFLHGNPIGDDPFHPDGGNHSLFWTAPCVYRLALAGFLRSDLTPEGSDGAREETDERSGQMADIQGMFERALWKMHHPTRTDRSPTS